VEHIETMSDRPRLAAQAMVLRELPADLETPVSAFLKMGANPPSFLLESVERGEQLGRYSFMGANPYLDVQTLGGQAIVQRQGRTTITALTETHESGDPLHLVQTLLADRARPAIPGLPRFSGGAVGYLGYDTVGFFEKLPQCPQDELQLPDSRFLFNNTLVIFDHVQHKIKVVSNPEPGIDAAVSNARARQEVDNTVEKLERPLPDNTQRRTHGSTTASPEPVSNLTRSEFTDMVERAKEYILAGDAFQIVLSQRLRRRTWADPFSIYRALRMLNPSPYMFYLDFGGFQLIGSSPEMLVKQEDGIAETRPIAGTRPRGRTEEEDNALMETLLADPKERAEHTMLVDLGRNDIGRVSRFGTVRVPVLMTIERYSHVMHIVSSVQGELDPGRNCFDLLRACFPAGTLSGAPKVRSMEIIAELEQMKRGPYGGAVGYFGFDGNMDTCIAIRTIVMVGDTVYLQGGAGIVADSDPGLEYEETLNKVQVLEEAVRLAESWKEPA